MRAAVCDSDGRCRQVTYRRRGQDAEPTANSATDDKCKVPQSALNNMGQNYIYKVSKWLKKAEQHMQ